MTAQRYYRKVIRITAEDSPNVRLARMQMEMGLTPTGQDIVPGVLDWERYKKRRATWDEIRQCVGLDAKFWEGKEVLLYPMPWLDRAEGEEIITRCKTWRTEGIGIDTAEGGDNTCMAALNRYGLKELTSKKTPDTNVVYDDAKSFIYRHGLSDACECVVFDRGGGGKQIADRLRRDGLEVRTVAFGESTTKEMRRGRKRFTERQEEKEERSAYVNRRAQIAYELSIVLDPAGGMDHEGIIIGGPNGFALPPEYPELRRQMAPIPRLTDGEGRYWMLPKRPRDDRDTRPTLIKLLGKSPDELDAVGLGLYAILHKANIPVAGAV